MLFTHTNPVRAGLAETPETAKYSSLRDRLEDLRVEESRGDVGGVLDDPRVDSGLERAGDDIESAQGYKNP